MPTDDEVKRLAYVYQTYQSKTILPKWDESNAGNRAILRERHQEIRNLLRANGLLSLSGRRVLDVGCGCGDVLASLVDFGAQTENLYGVDLFPDVIAVARQKHPGLHFHCVNAEQVDFPNSYFGLVLLFTVFSSILDKNMARNVAHEVFRVLEPGAAILWYDLRYNNPWNPNVRGMTLERIHQVFPDLKVELHPITLLPSLARRLGRLTPVCYRLLATLPPLRTHYLGLLVKPVSEGGSQLTFL